eukprot:TRINITY_DN9194_c0_g1_i5.p1 TRINITY_DN9194_c0_g1~~TRINITY_DN9194_c0_g1_i5.p1  ORF type:complete len:552 (-),score=49.45 TRINITY_DN9194_c0_g1_i5:59-1714(-)
MSDFFFNQPDAVLLTILSFSSSAHIFTQLSRLSHRFSHLCRARDLWSHVSLKLAPTKAHYEKFCCPEPHFLPAWQYVPRLVMYSSPHHPLSAPRWKCFLSGFHSLKHLDIRGVHVGRGESDFDTQLALIVDLFGSKHHEIGLESLQITFGSGNNRPMCNLLDFLAHFPTLRTVRVISLGTVCFLTSSECDPPPQWPALTHLHLICTSIDTTGLRGLESVTSLSLVAYNHVSQLSDLGQRFPALRSLKFHKRSWLELCSHLQEWGHCMPYLHTLALMASKHNSLSSVLECLEYFSLDAGGLDVWPSLHTLEIQGGHVFPGEQARDTRLVLRPTLKRLHFRKVFLNLEHPPFDLPLLNSLASCQLEEVSGYFPSGWQHQAVMPALATAFPHLKRLLPNEMLQPRFEFWCEWARCELARSLEQCRVVVDWNDEAGKEPQQEAAQQFLSSWDVPLATLREVGWSLVSLRYLSLRSQHHPDFLFAKVCHADDRRLIECLLIMATCMPNLRALGLPPAVLQSGLDERMDELLTELRNKQVVLFSPELEFTQQNIFDE